MSIFTSIKKMAWVIINKVAKQSIANEPQLLLLGRMLSETIKDKRNITSLFDVEFKVFSQWGDDGIIQWLINNLDIENKTFIEFGVQDYRESNTRFLMMNDNWQGMIIDGTESNINQIKNSEYYWKYSLLAKTAFIDRDNINDLLQLSGFHKEVGILHIDIDGNDYWIWEEINVISPIIVILEYNSVFGAEKSITVPYDKSFYRTSAHYSNLYFGASIRALFELSEKKGYSFVGCNNACNNAYFVRNDKLNDNVSITHIHEGLVNARFRESRDIDGKMTYLIPKEQLKEISGMPVYNLHNNKIENL